MEVHHHPDIHHKSKKWKEYFLEFLMIFLAVTMGFIAENIREHITERKKERQYIEGFIRNLKEDTANLHHVIEFGAAHIKGLDSMMTLTHAKMEVDSNRKAFYYYVTKYCYSSSSFKSNDATIQQLKSTGDYRLIEKDHVIDSITRYDTEIHEIYEEGDYYKAYFKEILSHLDELTDMTVIGDTSYLNNGNIQNKVFPALRMENGKLTTFFNKLFVFKIITTSYVDNNLMPLLEDATRLIEFLKKKYKIED